uniref:Uncharacterized protein n=1 Tax=Anguilla anguilla TaxID=7936 RepID=A0A0E9WDG5_ANGAN
MGLHSHFRIYFIVCHYMSKCKYDHIYFIIIDRRKYIILNLVCLSPHFICCNGNCRYCYNDFESLLF